MKAKHIFIILLIVIGLLLIPFIAMQFTDEVQWGVFDFVVMGAILLFTGILIEISLRKIKNQQYRFLVILVFILLMILVIAEMAVGIFGTPIAGS